MKYLVILLLAALLPVYSATAQTPDPVRGKLDLIFANIDKSQVPTGRLAEYAIPLAPLPPFDGVLRDSGRTDMDGFRHLYATALTSRITGSDTLPGLLTFNQRVQAAAPASPGEAIPVAVQYISYAQLRPDAEAAGLVTLQNEQLFDVAGRQQSPYQTAVLFAAAPERAYSASNEVSLVLRRNLYLASGAPTTSPSLYLDFDDGQGYRPATWNTPLSTSYTSAGTKRVKVKLVYTYRASFTRRTVTRESWFDLTVFAVHPAARYTDGPDIPFAPTVSGPFRADYTDHLGALVNVRYGQGHTQITKPFIVVEGYNTARIAPHLVGNNNQNNDITTFLREVDRAAPFGFHNNLYQAGYDLIYIDFREGTDDIRRNAALFEEVVRWVNQQKQSATNAEPNVVMGESMGGLVARYGLARMVRNGLNPQTRLLVLHDSPQRGANNPMSLQALTRQSDFPAAPNIGAVSSNRTFLYTSDLSDKLKEALAILEAPATKQLSLKNVTDINSGYADNTFVDGPYKDMVEFGGTPPATFPFIVATSDGSQCGQRQNIQAHQELARNDRLYFLTAFYVVGAGIKSEAWANALPIYGTQERIAHLRVWFTIRVLWARIDVPLLNRNYDSPASTLPYETLPGGTTNLNDQQDVAGNFHHPFIFWNFFSNTTFYNGDICFVPTYSALAVPTVTPATAYAKYINDATDNPSRPNVTHYIAQEQGSSTQFNQAHIRFTARNSEWIFNEMQGQSNLRLSCTSECSPPLIISGPGNACGAVTYSAPSFRDATYSWTTSPAGAFSPATGTGSTFATTATGSGTGQVSVAVTSPCPNTSFTTSLPVVVCTSPLNVEITSLYYRDYCTSPEHRNNFAEWTAAATGGDGSYTYEWYFDAGGSGILQGPFGSGPNYGMCLNDYPPYTSIRVNVVVTSGPQQKAAEYYATSQPRPALYPNPADEYLNVVSEATDPAPTFSGLHGTTQHSSAAAESLQVTVYNSRGIVVLNASAAAKSELRLDTRTWLPGLYQVTIRRGSTQTHHQLSVQH